MNIDHLIKMANQIGSFFATEPPPGRAPADVAAHLRRYWEPRMRAQMLTYYKERQGAGLDENALGAIAILAAEAKAKADAAGGPAGAAAGPTSGASKGA